MRLIDAAGENKGVVTLSEALAAAHDAGMDLVEIAPTASPPVARIIDFGKFLYQQEKQERKQKAKTKTVGLKAVKVGLRIFEHDALIKIKKLEEFLEEGHKVKVEMFLRGRERANMLFAQERYERFLAMITAPHKIEQPTKKLPTGFITIIGK